MVVYFIFFLHFSLKLECLCHSLFLSLLGYIIIPPANSGDETSRLERSRRVGSALQFDWLPAELRPLRDRVIYNLEQYALFLCYIAMLLVGILSSVGVISLFYLVFLFVCLLIHMSATKPLRYVRAIWPVLIFFAALMLMVCCFVSLACVIVCVLGLVCLCSCVILCVVACECVYVCVCACVRGVLAL